MASLLNLLLQGVAQHQGIQPSPQPQTGSVAPPNAGQTPPIPQQVATATPPPTANQKPPPVDPQGKPIDPNSPNEVPELVVTPPPRPAPNAPPINYDNSRDAQALANSQDNVPRVDGGTGAGVWGMLPQAVQHGTLRDVLGAIGDGFLMHGGQKPEYQNRVDSRRIGQAMAGYANNPQAAIERVAATGSPGSTEMADKMETNNQNLEIRRQIAEQNNQYRQTMTDSRNQAIIERMAPTVAGWAQNAKNPQEYAAVYARADAAAKRVSPTASAADFGYVEPEDWKPGAMSGIGATTGQQDRSQVSYASIDERRQAAAQNSADRRAALRAHPPQVTNAGMLDGVRQRVQNGTASATDQQVWNRYLHGTKGAGAGLHSATTGGPSPSATDISYLKQHPNMKAQFEAHFGKGSSSQYVR